MQLPVRTKLTLLVASPLLLIGSAIPLLSYVQHRELMDAADDQVKAAERSLQAELDDDLADLELAATIMATSQRTPRAIEKGDAATALVVAQSFAKLYPRVDILIAVRDGRVLGHVGPTTPPASLKDIPELHALSGPMHLIIGRGCARPGASPPAHAILKEVGTLGWVLACEPLDDAYLTNAASKLGVELALVDASSVIAATAGIPREAVGVAGLGTRMVGVGGRSWAVHRFRPERLHGIGARMEVTAAIDISKMSASVHRHLWQMLGLLVLVAAIAIAASGRIARRMAGGLRHLIEAYKKLAEQIYVRVPVLRTRDEIELLAVGFNQMVEGLKERDKLRTTFGKYMTASVVDYLLRGEVELGGKSLRVTILFSDIRSFTSIAEKMDAHSLVALLNEYFTEMVTVVMKHGGVVDKYIGDGLMAVFGAPVPSDADAANAVRAAVEMRRSLARLNERLAARGVQPLRTGIGIHTGEVVAGNIGSDQRMEYTVIGDPVNVASRLESCTKELGVDVLISDATYELAKGVVEARPVKAMTVKGRAEPVMTYEVIADKP
jgi:adenylate cyclase